jgi:predicted tellurium resistance membrane protein TerC
LGTYVPKGYIYAAMMFSVFIELINMAHRRRAQPVHLRNPYGPEHPEATDERQALEEAKL